MLIKHVVYGVFWRSKSVFLSICVETLRFCLETLLQMQKQRVRIDLHAKSTRKSLATAMFLALRGRVFPWTSNMGNFM